MDYNVTLITKHTTITVESNSVLELLKTLYKLPTTNAEKVAGLEELLNTCTDKNNASLVVGAMTFLGADYGRL